MERVRDFSPYELKVSVYDGAAEKRTMLMDGHLYMVKFGYDAAPQEEHPSRTSYVNLPVNEYIGSKVFAASGIPTQDVILGDYKGRSVVACRDFMYEMDPNLMLLHFKQLEISMPGGSSRSKARPDWEFVSQVLDEHDALEGIRARARHRFLQMTCVDALIGNFDRHANNWGFIADRRTADILDLAPVYDCGSSLSPSLSREGMRERVEDPQQMREANMAAPYMAMNVGGKRRKFAFFLTSETARPFSGRSCRNSGRACPRRSRTASWSRPPDSMTFNVISIRPRWTPAASTCSDPHTGWHSKKRKPPPPPSGTTPLRPTSFRGSRSLALGETPVSCTEDSTRLTVREGPRSRRQSFPDRSMTVSRWSISSRHCRTA